MEFNIISHRLLLYSTQMSTAILFYKTYDNMNNPKTNTKRIISSWSNNKTKLYANKKTISMQYQYNQIKQYRKYILIYNIIHILNNKQNNHIRE